MRRVHVEPAFACGVVPPVALVVCRRPADDATIERCGRAFAECAAAIDGPFASVTVIEPTSAPPSGRARGQIEADLDSHPRLTAIVAVLVGRPAWLAWGMDVAHEIAAPRSRARRSKVCVDVAEALTWLERVGTPPIAPGLRAELEAALAELAAAMPPAP